MTDVFLAKCENYSRPTVEQVVENLLTQMGGTKRFVKPGQTVLLKVNLLSPVSPDKAVTTHPEIARAVAKLFCDSGARVLIGDSSGGIIPEGNRTSQALKTAGIQAIADELGVEAVNFDTMPIVELANPRGAEYEKIYLAKPVLDADLVVSLPKLKTHSFTLFTGAVKNMYGCIPGGRKAWYHRVAPSPRNFSEYLVDVYSLARPHLAIMDGVVAMEGDGPSAGNPRQVSTILASSDSVALDAVACRLVSLDPAAVSMLNIAKARSLGETERSQIRIHGPYEELRISDFRGRKKELQLPEFLAQTVMRMFYAYPLIDQDKCVSCQICLHSCPVHTINENPAGEIEITQEDCIRCYCCHEHCPKHAIELKSSFLLRQFKKARQFLRHDS